MMSSQVSTAGVESDLKRKVQELERQLTEARQQQDSTSAILHAISSCTADVVAILESIATTAARLLDVKDVEIMQVEGDNVKSVARYGTSPQWPLGTLRRVSRDWIAGRAVIDRIVVHVADLQAEEREFPLGAAYAREYGHRSTLAAPLLRNDVTIGAILMRRMEVRPFSQRQIKLVETFASQAVIAIENTRLLNELRESLQQQTATADVLKVISHSHTDIQPVFDTIVENMVQLGDGVSAFVYQFDGDLIRLVAHDHSVTPEALKVFNDIYPLPPSRTTVIAQTILDRTTVHVRDFESDLGVSSASREMARAVGHRSLLAVPMLREGRPIGAICVGRRELHGAARPFSDRDIELLKSFADQAVIAIENTRLFDEVQARTRELTESLKATSGVLTAISRSPTDVQPVFDTIAESAAQLCKAEFCNVFRFDGQLVHFAASHGVRPEARDAMRSGFPLPPGRGFAAGRAILSNAIEEISDLDADADYALREIAKAGAYGSIVAVPMRKDGSPIGALAVGRSQIGRFPDRQIALLETFADQAVIAIENTRLFEEVQARTRELTRSVAELRSLGQVGQTVSSSLELSVVLSRILEHACAMSDTGGGAIYVFDKTRGLFDLEAGYNMSEELIAAVRKHPIRLGESSVGQCAERRETVQLVDLTDVPPHPLYKMHIESGTRALLAVPLLHQDEVIGALVVRRRTAGEFPGSVVELMQTFANQSAIAIENARLFEEIAQKSRELEIASQHKSQFVANMSHELRTPLAAILGYADLIQEGFYGPQPEKSMDALTRIRSNGKHLLGLINTVLDIAKIEAGQFSLNLAEYALANVVETVCAATESLAETKKLALKAEVARSLPIGFGDEQRLTQVLLNLVGNAIKFTDTGEVRITAATVNGHFTVAVTDTGPGIPPEELKRVFEQFHQVDNSNTKKKGGTGLGLAIAKQIVEMHGGRVWVESEPGKGATFQMQLPVRAESRKAMQ